MLEFAKLKIKFGSTQDSNQGPSDYKSDALSPRPSYLGGKKAENLRLYRQWESFPFPFPPIQWRELGNLSCVVYTHTKLRVQAKKSPFWIFNGYMVDHFVSYSMLMSCQSNAWHYMKFNSFLHPNQHAQSIFFISCKTV